MQGLTYGWCLRAGNRGRSRQSEWGRGNALSTPILQPEPVAPVESVFVAAEADGTDAPHASQRQTEEAHTLRVVRQLQL